MAEDLTKLSRRELQALAKAAGIKANGKTIDIIAGLKALQSQQSCSMLKLTSRLSAAFCSPGVL